MLFLCYKVDIEEGILEKQINQFTLSFVEVGALFSPKCIWESHAASLPAKSHKNYLKEPNKFWFSSRSGSLKLLHAFVRVLKVSLSHTFFWASYFRHLSAKSKNCIFAFDGQE